MDFLLALNNRKYQEFLTLAGGPAQREAARFAALRVFHLNDLGTQPGERFGAGRAGLELGQVRNADAGKEARERAVATHFAHPFRNVQHEWKSAISAFFDPRVNLIPKNSMIIICNRPGTA